MDKKLYTMFIKEFANLVDQLQGNIADVMEADHYSDLYEYYHSRFKLDTIASEDAMWERFWADFNEAFTTFFKDYI